MRDGVLHFLRMEFSCTCYENSNRFLILCFGASWFYSLKIQLNKQPDFIEQ